MGRAPFQVLVFPYCKVGKSTFKYAVLRRADAGYWQAVAGGGEDDETPFEAAKRETHEEIGFSTKDTEFLQLDTVIFIPVTEFRDSYHWGDDVYVIPQHCFGVQMKNSSIKLSYEHTEYKWMKYKEVQNILKYEGDKTALWELDRKLRGLGPRD